MKRRALLALQALVSLVVVGLLWADAGPERVRSAFAGVDPRWLLAAATVQAAGLFLRATRVWSAMGGAAPYPVVLKGALTANLGHLLVPSRVADLAGAVWIARRAGLPVERGIAGYATAGFLEAVAFGTGLMGLFVGAAPVIEQVLTGDQRREALGWVSLATLGAVGVAAVALRVIRSRSSASSSGGRGGSAPPATPPHGAEPHPPLGGRTGPRRRSLREALSPATPSDAPPGASFGGGVGIADRLRGAVDQARTILARPGPLLLNLVLGAAQIGCMLGVFRCALAAVSLEVPAPWLCGALVMAVGAVGGMVLPPHYGANTSAAATLVLTPFGATAPEALAFGGVLWFAAAAPDVIVGLFGLWLGGELAVGEREAA